MKHCYETPRHVMLHLLEPGVRLATAMSERQKHVAPYLLVHGVHLETAMNERRMPRTRLSIMVGPDGDPYWRNVNDKVR